MKRITTVIFVIILMVIAAITFRTYPRNISLSLKGVEYQLGRSSHYDIKPITLKVKGIRKTSLLGHHTFTGTITIIRNSAPNHGIIRSSVNSFTSGDPLAYLDSHSKVVTYGVMFNNSNMSKITVEVFQPNGGWNSGNGLMISAPARTRTQALQVSNTLVKFQLIHGYPLK